MDDVLILAGGFGERLWPASSKAYPKQFMTADGKSSFLADALSRALYVKRNDNDGYIVVITRSDIASICISQLSPYANQGHLVLLVEPEPRHTSAAIMSGVALCRHLSGERARTTLVLTSDHIITPVEAFESDCAQAQKAALDGSFVCFSIPPTAPSTGYGYIKTGRSSGENKDIRPIEKFIEKPPLETAKEYLSSGDYSWNSGMFAFLSSTLLNEMALHTPQISSAYSAVFNGNLPPHRVESGIMVVDDWTELNEAYSKVPKIAIDKAVAEKTEHAVSVTAHFKWHDVGSWDTFATLCKPSFPDGGVAEVDGSGNFVYSDIPVALCGVSDLVVVVKNGALLVMRKGKSTSVRDAVHLLGDKTE